MWYTYALIGAFLLALSDVLTKKLLFKEHALEFLSTKGFTMLIILLVSIPLVRQVPSWNLLLLIYFVSLTISVALWLEAKAFRHLEISVMEPLYNLSPIFLVLFAFLFLGERLSIVQGIGVVCLVIGAYVLEWSHSSKNVFAPLKAMASSSPTRYLLIALVLLSAVSTFERYLVTHLLDAFTYTYFAWLFICINLIVLDWYFFRLKQVKQDLKKYGFWTFVVALMHFVSILMHMYAVTIAAVSLVLPVRRLSTLFATFLGGRIFHEKGLSSRILACVILLIGAILIIV